MDKEQLSYAQTELFAETGSEKQGEVELRNLCRSHEANGDGRQAGRYRSGLGESASPGYQMPGSGERHNGKQSTEKLSCGNTQKLLGRKTESRHGDVEICMPCCVLALREFTGRCSFM